MATVKEVLIQARELIADPDNWTQGALARNAAGLTVSYDAPSACRWCADGAVYRILDNDEAGWGAFQALDDCAKSVMSQAPGAPGVPTVNVNDVLGHQAIVDVFDRAIASAP